MERVASRQLQFHAVVVAVLLQLLRASLQQLQDAVQVVVTSASPTHLVSEPDCYHDGFNLTCDYSFRPPRLFLGDGTVEVLEIFIPNGTVRINSTNIMPLLVDTDDSDSQPQLIRYLLLHGECSGLGCCGGGIPKGYTSYHIQLQPSNDSSFDAKSSVYIAEDGSYNISKLMYEPRGVALPALLDWVISNSSCQKQHPVAPACRSSNSFCQNYTSYVYNGYQCRCSSGYHGTLTSWTGAKILMSVYIRKPTPCHGTCENMPGTFHCRCPDGTYGNPAIKVMHQDHELLCRFNHRHSNQRCRSVASGT
ncbi:hypothetical protein ACQ4PT_028083 [Festuca glaucescens]